MSIQRRSFQFYKYPLWPYFPWWRYQMETFSALLALCAGNSPVNSPHKGPVKRSFGVFFNLRLNKRLSKHSWGRWFEATSRSLWRHCNVCNGNPYTRKTMPLYGWCLSTLGQLTFYGCFDIRYPNKTHLKLKSREITPALLITYCPIVKSFRRFAQSTAVSLPCSVQIFKTIWQRKLIF